RSYGDWSSDVCSSDLRHSESGQDFSAGLFTIVCFELSIRLHSSRCFARRDWNRGRLTRRLGDQQTLSANRRGGVSFGGKKRRVRSEERRVGKECRLWS